MKKQTCIYCGAPAVRWCDYVLGWDASGFVGGLLQGADAEIHRCDAPLCGEHASNRGSIFISSRKPGVGGHDSIDWCCGHPEREPGIRPITADEAAQVRYRHRCMAGQPLRAIDNPQRSLFEGQS